MDNQHPNNSWQTPPGGANGNPYNNPNGYPYGNPNGNPYGYPNNGPYGYPYGTPWPIPGYPLRNAELKRIARQSLTGHYGTMIGIWLLLSLFSMVISYLFSFIGNQLFLMCTVAFETDSEILQYGLSFVLNFIASLLTCLFSVGSAKAFIQLLYGQPVHVSMLFYGFKNHPDRIMSANIPVIVITLVCSIPMTIYSQIYLTYMNEYMEILGNLNNAVTPDAIPMMPPSIMIWALISMVSSVVMLFAVLPFSMVDYLLAEMEGVLAADIIRTSFSMMKGHKMRYLGLTLSFLGWIFLGIFTCGIALFWVMPYMQATMAAFYLDLKRVHEQRQQMGNPM